MYYRIEYVRLTENNCLLKKSRTMNSFKRTERILMGLSRKQSPFTEAIKYNDQMVHIVQYGNKISFSDGYSYNTLNCNNTNNRQK